MTTSDLLVDGFGRVHDAVHAVLKDLVPEAASYRPDDGANPITWLIWHLTRVQDDHVAHAAGREQRWTAEGWVDKFDLPSDPLATGFGQRAEETGRVHANPSVLLGYHDAVHGATVDFVGSLVDADLDRVVDRRWDPPVTLGVRLVSVLADDLQHAGQATYVRGLFDRH